MSVAEKIAGTNMRSQTRHSCGKVNIGLCAAVVLTLCAFAWMTKAYFAVRLELMEARGVLADILHGSGIIDNSLAAGNVEKAHGIAVTNQLKGIQYAVRRNVKDRNIHQSADYCFRQVSLPMSGEQRGFYIQYDEGYRSWTSSGWVDDNIPLMDQFMDVLHYYWPDCRPRWTTWKPRDFATNIKVGSPEDRPKKRHALFEDQKSLSERLNHALEKSDCVTNLFAYGEMVKLRDILISELLKSKTRGFSSSAQTNAFGEVTRVALFGSHITQTNICLVSSIPTLEAFCLCCCTNETNNIDEKAFLSLRHATNLKDLEIYGGVPLITEQMCEAIASLRQLKNLKIEFCPIELAGEAYLRRMNYLSSLVLSAGGENKLNK